MVAKCVDILTSLPDIKVLTTDIGVITPYIRQVYRIKTALKQKFCDVEVGTTETFQGREKRIILISCVRGQHDLLLYDKRYNLGFVSNEKVCYLFSNSNLREFVLIPLLLNHPLWLNYFFSAVECCVNAGEEQDNNFRESDGSRYECKMVAGYRALFKQ